MSRFQLVSEPTAIYERWSKIKAERWSQDAALLQAFSVPGTTPLLLEEACRPQLLLGVRAVQRMAFVQNLGGSWGEEVSLPAWDRAAWLELFSTLSPTYAGLELFNLKTKPTIRTESTVITCRYSLPAYLSYDEYIQDRFYGEGRRQRLRIPSFTLRACSYQEAWPYFESWQPLRHGPKANFSKPQVITKLQAVCGLLAARGLARHYLFLSEGVVVGAVLGFVYGDEFVLWQDCNQGFSRVGNTMNATLFRELLGQGLRIDWMTQTQKFKADFWRFDQATRFSTYFSFPYRLESDVVDSVDTVPVPL